LSFLYICEIAIIIQVIIVTYLKTVLSVIYFKRNDIKWENTITIIFKENYTTKILSYHFLNYTSIFTGICTSICTRICTGICISLCDNSGFLCLSVAPFLEKTPDIKLMP